MAVVFLILGAVMALGGVAGGIYSLDLLPTERGVAGVIAAATLFAGGVITAAVGSAVHKLHALLTLLAGVAPEAQAAPPPEPRMSAPQVDAPPAPAPVEVAPVAVAPQPVVAPALPEAPAKTLNIPMPPRQLSTAPAVAAGATAAVAGAAVLATATLAAKAEPVVDKAVEKAIEPVITPPPAPIAPPQPKPVVRELEPELPVEVLRPVETTLHDALVAAKPAHVPPPVVEEPRPAAPVLPETAIPTETPAPASAAPESDKDDPFSAFEAELDRLIPMPKAKTAPAHAAPTPERTKPEPAHAAAEHKPAAHSEVVGAYESGGAKYTMFADGSVIAEAEGQTIRFTSLEELRAFIEAGQKAG